ncbi:hypothetical protein EOL70_12205 [Leucothrix sargassi]|nr:hypothetical protein EOL70_12205 [Leucothrix sargassi]
MRYLLLTSLTLLLNACATYDFVPTPVPELISKVTYTTTGPSGGNTWQLDNDTLSVKHLKLSHNGQVIGQRVSKATSNEFNIIATGLEKADFQKATSVQGSGPARVKEILVVETFDSKRTFTQDEKTRFPEEIQAVTQQIPQLF